MNRPWEFSIAKILIMLFHGLFFCTVCKIYFAIIIIFTPVSNDVVTDLFCNPKRTYFAILKMPFLWKLTSANLVCSAFSRLNNDVILFITTFFTSFLKFSFFLDGCISKFIPPPSYFPLGTFLSCTRYIFGTLMKATADPRSCTFIWIVF